MRTILVCTLALLSGYILNSQIVTDPPNGVPYSTNGILAAIDLDNDGTIDITYAIASQSDGIITLNYTGFATDEHSSYLASANKSALFSQAEVVSTNRNNFINGAGIAGLAPDAYQWEMFSHLGTSHYRYSRVNGGQFQLLTNALVGLRFLGGDNYHHHAWIRLTRPDNVAGTPFQVASYGYNPLPDEPIQAGLPAPPPAVTSSMDIVNGGFVFSWAAKTVPYYKLQARPDLDPATEWTDVDTGDGHSYAAASASEQAYYRLVQR